MVPYTYIQNAFRGIIPVFILIFLNARIVNVLRRKRVVGKKFTSRNRITLMLVAVVVVFIVCITPDAIMSFFGKGYVEESYRIKGLRELTDALLALNSAVNFVLYCTFSYSFREKFYRLFFPRKFAQLQQRTSRRSRTECDANYMCDSANCRSGTTTAATSTHDAKIL